METIAKPVRTAVIAAPRLDFYAGIHKALRAAMADALLRLGRMDAADAADVVETTGRLNTLLGLLASHVKHENEFVHTAIEARRAGGSAVTADAHDEHVASIQALRAEARALGMLPPERRAAPAHRLYQHVALFVAENLSHMQFEETVNNAALWAMYTDAELAAIHDRLVASVEPQAMAEIAGWMAEALSPAELAGMLLDMRSKMPPEAFVGVFALIAARLTPVRRAKIDAALGSRR